MEVIVCKRKSKMDVYKIQQKKGFNFKLDKNYYNHLIMTFDYYFYKGYPNKNMLTTLIQILTLDILKNIFS